MRARKRRRAAGSDDEPRPEAVMASFYGELLPRSHTGSDGEPPAVQTAAGGGGGGFYCEVCREWVREAQRL